ncbi:AMP nucleosidase (modular protein) [Azospirillaceae bacterium]
MRSFLPGGFGTLDETIEIITWKQLRLHDKPIVIIDVDGFWKPMLSMFDHLIEEGFASAGHRRLFTVIHQTEQVFDALHFQPEPVLYPETKWM